MIDDAAKADGDSEERSEDDLFGAGGKVDRDALYRLHDAREDDDAPVEVQFKLSRDLKKRLDRYLVDRIPFMSRTALQRLIEEEAVVCEPKTKHQLEMHCCTYEGVQG